MRSNQRPALSVTFERPEGDRSARARRHGRHLAVTASRPNLSCRESRRSLDGRSRFATPVVCGLFLCGLLLCGLLSGCVMFQVGVTNPVAGLTTVAVVPFFNLSSERAVDGRRFAEAYFAELQKTPGFQVLPVGVVEQAIHDHRLEMNGPDDALKLAAILNVDAVVMGAVTDYSPYYPPRIGLQVSWYSPRPWVFVPGVQTDEWAREAVLPKPFSKDSWTSGTGKRSGGKRSWWTGTAETGPSGSEQCPPQTLVHPTAIRGQSPESFTDTRPERSSWWPGWADPRRLWSRNVPATAESPPSASSSEGTRRANPEAEIASPSPSTTSAGIVPASGREAMAPDVEEWRRVSADTDGGATAPNPMTSPGGTSPAIPVGPRPEGPLPVGPWPGNWNGLAGPAMGAGPAPMAPLFQTGSAPPFNPRLPLMAYTRMFDGSDPLLTARLRDYVELSGDLRSGGWQAYLHRSEDFIRFTAHLMIVEMLQLHGGEAKRRIVIKPRRYP